MMGATEVRELEVREETKVRTLQVAKKVAPPLPELPLFASSLLEFAGFEKRRRSGATLLSFIFQCLLIAIGLIVPLMMTDALPQQQLLTFLVAPPPPPPPPPPAAEVIKIVRQIQTDLLNNGQLRTPSRIPQKVQVIKEEDAPPPMPATGGVFGGVPGGVPGGQFGGVIGGIITAASNLSAVPKLVPVAPKRVRVSQGVTQGMLVYRLEPAYPQIARMARIAGSVVLTAVIAKNGEIENLTLVSGHPMLAPAAIEAVKQWRYRPYLLNGEPVEVETTITVSFQLSS
jgi:periplasmic protein TonB